MAEKARNLEFKGNTVLHLEIGEPSFDTPEHIKNEALRAIKDGFTHYTSSRGILELRQAISKDLAKRNINANPKTEIIVTPGAKHALYCACLSTLNPGDEVLILTPTWPTHFQCVEFAYARPIEISCGSNYILNEEELKSKITKKSKMILINSPNNPTGGILNEEGLNIIADIAKDKHLLILSDEIYDRLIYDDYKIKSVGSFDDIKERTVIINGFSKTYAMTGWRLGYVYANKDIIEAIMKIQQSTTTCPASFTQKAGVVALNSDQDFVDTMIMEYDRRRKFFVKGLNAIKNINCQMPKGAFYVFPDFSKLNLSSWQICEELLENEYVSSTPGLVFGNSGKGHIRLCYAKNIKILSEALSRIKNFVEKLS
jgi:aspartate/methionine/tyrosine aminotransferase